MNESNDVLTPLSYLAALSTIFSLVAAYAAIIFALAQLFVAQL